MMTGRTKPNGAGFLGLVEKLSRRDNRAPGDYVQDGILMCGTCRTPKQSRQKLPVFPIAFDRHGNLKMEIRLAPIACQCAEERMAREKEQTRNTQFRYWMETHMQYGISGGLDPAITFDADNGSDLGALATSQRYVEKWREMRENNIGLLFSGPRGVGKSFHAGMIMNALLEKRIPCLMTSFPTLLAAMEKWGEKQRIVSYLDLFDLVVIDDLGTERDSPYALEQIYLIVDTRYRQRKPLIVTTNLSVKTLKQTSNLELGRIYSRILEMCPLTYTMVGQDQREALIEQKLRAAEAAFQGD